MIGHETMSKGLAAYFAKHKWSNSELPDFIGALNDAYKAAPKADLGADFDFESWASTWLNTSGANRMEGKATYSDDKRLESLQIHQTCELRGQNQLRKHKMDIGLFDSKAEVHVLRGVIINEQEVTEVDLSSLSEEVRKDIQGVMPNWDDMCFCTVRFSQETLDWFENNLAKI